MDEKTILSKASAKLKTLVKNDIISKGLVKTGALVQSIEADFVETGDELTIEIGAVYYYAFLDDGTRFIEAYNITEDVTNSSAFQVLLEDTITSLLEVRLDNALKRIK